MVAVREGDNVRRFVTSSGLIADVFAPNRPVGFVTLERDHFRMKRSLH